MQPEANSQTTSQALLDTLAQSLETMAFVMLDPVDGPQALPEDTIVASMTFAGPTSGRIDIAAPRAFAMMLAANVLGTDPADIDAIEKADDVMKELVNVVGGALMPHLAASPEDVFKLAIPTLSNVDEVQWSAFSSDSAAQVVMADGHVLAARIV